MLFVEPRFLFFLLVVLAVHWALRANRARKLWLLSCSYFFYGSWDWRFLSLILVSTAVDYGAGLALGSVQGTRPRRAWLALSVSVNIGILAVFKYFDFFARSAAPLLRWLGIHPDDVTLHVVLPVGISFYTFQTMSYTIDVYRRRLEPTRSVLDLATFVAFFPQLVAGPIVRAVDFLPQLERARSFARDVHVRRCLVLFLVGYFKKSCLADNVAIVVDDVFAEPGSYSAAGLWLALGLYAIQFYGDFSGYTDMAFASAGLLGYRLAENFHFPFFSTGVAAFWRRWHISLSTWFRDYLYLSLGGNRVSRPRVFVNVYLTLGLVGLWHGAAWNFVLFGLVHATYLIVEQGWARWRPATPRLGAAALPVTFSFLLLSLPFFRSTDAELTSRMFRVLLLVEPGGDRAIGLRWCLLFAACTGVHWLFYRRHVTVELRSVPSWLFFLGYGAAWALVLPCVSAGYEPFIYFQF